MGVTQQVCAFILVILTLSSQAAKLNKPRVLLPLYSQHASNFSLHVEDGGCYSWSSKSPSIVQLWSESGCSSHATVAAATLEGGRHTAIVVAEDRDTGEMLRCDVIVDGISSLSIATTTRKIFIEDAPEVFEVHAYDSTGNQFSTLDGFAFSWEVSGISRKGSSPVIRLTNFEDSSYKVPSSILAEIEASGHHGNMVLLSGLHTGQARVSVSLPQPQYRHVPPAPSVTLAVVANLQLDPPEVLLLPGANITYRLELIRQGRPEVIPLPSEQYSLEVVSTKYARLTSGSTVLALEKGRTQVLLRDANADPDENAATYANLRVAPAAAIQLEVLPTRSWQAIVGRDYELTAQVLDEDKLIFHLGAEESVSIALAEAYFSVSRRQGGRVFGRAIATGAVDVHARLMGTTLRDDKTLVINDQLSIYPPHVYLPWHPASPAHKVHLRIECQTGDNKPAKVSWRSSNPNLGSVSASGIIRTAPGRLNPQSSFNVTASLIQDPLNHATATLHVLPPVRLSIVQEGLQAETGATMHLQVLLLLQGRKNSEILAQSCESLPLEVHLAPGLSHDPSENGAQVRVTDACTTVALTASEALVAKVGISLQYVSERGDIVHLSDETTVRFYAPLRVVSPANGITILAPGTSRVVVFEGGPREGRLSRTFSLKKPHLGEVWELENGVSPSVFSARVHCNDEGSTELWLSLSEGTSVTKASVQVICAIPAKVKLSTDLPQPDLQLCPISADSQVSLATSSFSVIAEVLDVEQRKFDNVSSLKMIWDVSPPLLAHPLPRLAHEITRFEEGDIALSQLVKPKGIAGILEVEAVLKYREIEVRGSTSVALVEETLISPLRLSLYNHTSKPGQLKISRGSNYYRLNLLEGEGVAEVKLLKNKRIVQVTPKQPGHIRIAITDACLPVDAQKASVAEVTVLGIGSVAVTVASQVAHTRSMDATLALMDSEGRTLVPPSDLQVRATYDSGILSVKRREKTMTFTLTGLTLGDSDLVFEVDNMQSSPNQVHVFPPIKIWPRELLLVPGSSLQVLTRGGPRVPDAVLQYRSSSTARPAALHIQDSGLLEARQVGQAQVSVKAIAPNQQIYSEDSVPVRVTTLSSIEIWAPTVMLEQGTRMPAYVQGRSDTGELISSFILATLNADHSWSEHSGCFNIVSYGSVAHLEALKVGVTEMSVQMLQSDGTKLRHTLKLEVVPRLSLQSPIPSPPNAEPLLLAPHAQVQVAPSSGTFSLDCGASDIVSVNPSGLITSMGPLGRATLLLSNHKTGQELSIPVKVVPVHYVMVRPLPPLAPSHFPRGMSAALETSHHDSLGRPVIVPASSTPLRARSSNLGVLSLQQGRLQLGEEGRAVLEITDNQHFALVALSVKQVISPLTVIQGQQLCFSLGHPGQWSAQPSSVLHIDEESGLAIALSPGKVVLQFLPSSESGTWAEVQVLPVSSVRLVPTSPPALNRNKALLVPVQLLEANGKAVTSPQSSCSQPSSANLSAPSPIECEALWDDGQSDETLTVTSVWQNGVYMCQVSTDSEQHAKLLLRACLQPFSQLCSERISVPYYRSITLETRELVLGDEVGYFVVSGPSPVLEQLTLEASPPLLNFGSPKMLSKETVSFPVTINPMFWALPDSSREMKLTAVSQLTGQKESAWVRVEAGAGQEMTCRVQAGSGNLFEASSYLHLLLEHKIKVIIACITLVIGTILHLYFSSASFNNVVAGIPLPEKKPTRNSLSSPLAGRGSPFLSPGNLDTSGLSSSASPGPLYPHPEHIYGDQNSSWAGGSPRRM